MSLLELVSCTNSVFFHASWIVKNHLPASLLTQHFLVKQMADHTLRVDSSDQFQTGIFEIHNLSIFSGKDLKKVFLTSGFPNKNGTQQMLYMYLILTQPMLLVPYFWAISCINHSMFFIYLHSYTVFKPLLVMFFVRV